MARQAKQTAGRSNKAGAKTAKSSPAVKTASRLPTKTSAGNPAKKKAAAAGEARSPRLVKTVKPKAVSPKPAKPVVARKPPRKAEQGGNGEVPESVSALRKTHLTAEELESFREMLMAKRRELVGDVANLESEAMNRNTGSGTINSTMPIHMADLGSDTWEQELTLGLIERERGLLREIDEALARIENRTYGICLATNRPISKSRLRAQPWAKYCIEYARKRELGLA